MVAVADLLVTLIAISCVAAAPPPSLDEQNQVEQTKVCTADLKITADLTLDVSQNYQCGEEQNTRCPGLQCCSKDNYCGPGPAFCEVKCKPLYGSCQNPLPESYLKSLPLSTNYRCGREFNTKCPNNECCSKDGYCGGGSAECGAGCQDGFGICKLPTFPKRPETNPTASVDVFGSCISKDSIALMFESGPNNQYMSLILAALNEKGAKASFFVNGLNDGDLHDPVSKDLVKEAYLEGHLIGTASLSYMSALELTLDQLYQEYKHNDALIWEIIGKTPVFARLPDSEYTDKIVKSMHSWGYIVAEATFDPKDYDHDGSEDFVEQMHKEYSKEISAKNGESHIVVHHQFVGGNVDWVRELLTKYQDQLGYKFVTIGECLGIPEDEWYHNEQPHL
ncbi:hypothetical protein BASA50_010192 [Batrachochytrium salamandrivorans]|uniref:NodB homology domain-containing protein n=1 Tax=Batrachochytrium salamandrivorans TaxID=1357716 RepID=A0ABQ8EZ95_9FUNG|nr:hypothetical protein BASA60_005538 [Batrachochytrium salamandrivorans]KAH6589214.1 hypothetical protein BASA50_010192 [Batrachochytrium salamandrivorans]KAH6599024.1 hypothetical protein BASA61_002703 [Batrachochytrium salamandrivorans]KAH9246649.1 hypothetical protein BASA81_015810 [Batrachochytrium salamandrivorans]KAH9266816.1 hypothetical protein BASA83_010325 [Batrachochytrium salamandrivorans]